MKKAVLLSIAIPTLNALVVQLIFRIEEWSENVIFITKKADIITTSAF